MGNLRLGALAILVPLSLPTLRPPAIAGESELVLSNEHLAITMSKVGKAFRTSRVENRRTGETLDIQGEDFVLAFADGQVVPSSALATREATVQSDRAGRHWGTIQAAGEGLDVQYVTELRSGRWWATRWLEIRGSGRKLSRVHLAQWQCRGAKGPADMGKVVDGSLGYPSGCGQAVYAGDLFVAIAHPGAENFATGNGISCSIPAYRDVSPQEGIRTPELVIGAGARGDAWRDFIRYIDATRPVPPRMLFLVNDWYWKDKSKPLQAFQALADVKRRTGIQVESFTLDAGWDFDGDEQSKIWGRLNRQRFPGGWEALQAVGRAADINVSLWFGPIGGYGDQRKRRVALGRSLGFEIYGDKLCLCGPRYKKHAIESFCNWAAQGMDYIKVDGFWPNCPVAEHGHPVGAEGAVAQMDGLIEVFAAWRKARPGLLIGYTSGSHPSPFWLQHADFVWRGGRDDSHTGEGSPFDKHNTYLDSVLQAHRGTDMPISAFVTFDIVQDRIRGGDDGGCERGFWWLAARTSLHHDWYLEAGDLTIEQWKMLARAARWAKQHEKTFRFSRMIGGNPARGEVYGFSAFDGHRGVLALRNPSATTGTLAGSLAEWALLPPAARDRPLRVVGVYGDTAGLEGSRPAADPLRIELPPLHVAIVELQLDGPSAMGPRTERILVQRDPASNRFQITIAADGNRVAWGDVARGLARAAGYDDSALQDMVPKGRFDVTSPWWQQTCLGLNLALAPAVRFAAEQAADQPLRLVISVDRDALQAKERWFKAMFRALVASRRPSQQQYGLSLAGGWEEAAAGQNVAIIVHGLDSHPQRFASLAAAMREAGVPWGAFRYPNDQPIADSAKLLAGELKRLAEKHPRRGFALVTSSMGGLVARGAIENPELDPGNVRRLIMIAPPNHGSSLAPLEFTLELWEHTVEAARRDETRRFCAMVEDGLSEAAEDLQPSSPFLRELNARPRNPRVRYTILLGNCGLVRPEELGRLRENVARLGQTSRVARFFGPRLQEPLEDLDEIVDGKGDGAVSLARGRLEGVEDTLVLRFSHIGTGPDANKVVEEVVTRLRPSA